MQTFWARVREHKVIQWGVAYLGAALALVHGTDLVSHALHWPDAVSRVSVIALIVGFPIALTLAWYHGHKGLTQIGAGELGIVAMLGLIGAVFFTAVLRPDTEHDTEVVAQTAEADGVGAASGREMNRGGTPLPQSTALPNSVAVLPFVNNSSDAEQEYFADGLADQLRDSLSRIQELNVTGRTSSFYFKGKTEELQTIGERLGVEWVVEGSVQRAGEELRITAELNNTRTGFRQWGDTYAGTLSNIFEIQDEITQSVAEALQITLGVGDLGSVPGMTRDVAAYEEFLTARGLIAEFGPDSIQRAIEHSERAIALDPSFAVAWTQLAGLYTDGSIFWPPEQAREWTLKGAEAIDRATELAPDSPGALYWRGGQSMQRGAWREAAVVFEEQGPALARAYGRFSEALSSTGMFLSRVGKTEEAIRILERARAAEPLAGLLALNLGEAYSHAGALGPALAEFDRGLSLGEGASIIRASAFFTALASGDRDEIDRRFTDAEANAPPGSPDAIYQVMDLERFLDDPEAARAEIRSLAASDIGEQALASSILATWAAYYDDPETSLALLKKSHSQSSQLVILQIWQPLFTDVRKLPGFKDLVRDIGLVEYWQEYGWADYCQPIGDNDFECE